MKTTFRKLKGAGACTDRYKHLAKALGGIRKYGRDTPITALQILEHNGMDDLWWAWPLFDKAKADRIGRLFACDCADRVRHLMKDERSTSAIDVARRHANGEASDDELAAAREAAWDAARDAARDAASDAASDAARDAARAAAWAADRAAARAAARYAAWAAARDAENEWQLQHIKEMLIKEAK